jgi:hypothetical protein
MRGKPSDSMLDDLWVITSAESDRCVRASHRLPNVILGSCYALPETSDGLD